MFSDNEKISGRQTCRFLILCALGTAALIVPRILARTSGNAGLYSIVLCVVLLLVYLFWTKKLHEIIEKLPRNQYPFFFGAAKIGKVLYSSILVLGGSFLLLQQSQLVCEMLLPDIPKWVISTLFLLLCGYGALNGIEDLARIGEVLFYLILFLLVILFLMTVENVPFPETFQWTFSDFETGIRGIFAGTLKILPYGLSFLLLPLHFGDFRDRKKGSKGAALGILFLGGFLGILYFFCTGVFGKELIAEQTWSIVELMDRVKLPGGLFGKVDAFFSLIFMLGMFFLISQILILFTNIWEQVTKYRKKKVFLLIGLVLVYFVSLLMGSYGQGEIFYQNFMEYFGLWFLFGWPLLQTLWLLFRKKGRFLVLLLPLFLLPAFLLTGCGTSLEDREFVLAIGFEKGTEEYEVTYAFPDLSKVSDQGGSMENPTTYGVRVSALEEAEKKYLSKTNREPDYNHLKAIVIQKVLWESEEFQTQFVDLCLAGDYGQDVVIFLTEGSALELLEAAAKENGSAGIYLEELCKNAVSLDGKKLLTIGDWCNLKTWNQGEMVRAKTENLSIPLLAVEEDRPTISQIIKCNQ